MKNRVVQLELAESDKCRCLIKLFFLLCINCLKMIKRAEICPNPTRMLCIMSAFFTYFFCCSLRFLKKKKICHLFCSITMYCTDSQIFIVKREGEVENHCPYFFVLFCFFFIYYSPQNL